jgi:hypothetical protein
MWRSLLVTWLGMIAMVVLICSVPLFAQSSSTIGLRSTLSSIPLSQQRVNATFYSLHPTSDTDSYDSCLLCAIIPGIKRGMSSKTGTL